MQGSAIALSTPATDCAARLAAADDERMLVLSGRMPRIAAAPDVDSRAGYQKMNAVLLVTQPGGNRLAIQVCANPEDPATMEREVRALAETDSSFDLLLLTLYKEAL